jgi:hypothetical protein
MNGKITADPEGNNLLSIHFEFHLLAVFAVWKWQLFLRRFRELTGLSIKRRCV